MKFNPVTFVIVIFFIYPILKGFLFKYSSNDLKEDINELNSNISFILALILGVYLTRKIFVQHDNGWYRTIFQLIPKEITLYLESKPFIIYIFLMPIIIYIIYKIVFLVINLINSITLYPIFDGIEKEIRNSSNFVKRIFGALVELPKALCYVFIVVFVLNLISISTNNVKLNRYLQKSNCYKYICSEVIIPVTNSKLAKQLPTILDNSFKIVVKDSTTNTSTKNNNISGKTIVYYNGVTLEEGVKSNSQIDNFARSLTANDSSIKDKAKDIYTWVGTNINYDEQKVNSVLNNNFDIKSGAIATFNSRKGICFDYSCLYVAMCRANGIKVRLVTGEGFNGVSWVSHAWNEVYLPNEDQWINVDTTFSRGGNYFNSRRFEIDHRNAKIAGEW